MDKIYIDSNESTVMTQEFGADRMISLADTLDKFDEVCSERDYLKIEIQQKDIEIDELKERLLKYE